MEKDFNNHRNGNVVRETWKIGLEVEFQPKGFMSSNWIKGTVKGHIYQNVLIIKNDLGEWYISTKRCKPVQNDKMEKTVENKELITKELIKFEKGAIKILLNKEYSQIGYGCSYYLDSDYKGSHPIYYHIPLNISQLRELRDILNKELFDRREPENNFVTKDEFEGFIKSYNDNMNRLNNVTEKVNLQIQKTNNIIEHIQGITSTLDYLYKYTKEIGRMFLEIAKSFKDEE